MTTQSDQAVPSNLKNSPRDIKILKHILKFIKPYKTQAFIAIGAICFTAFVTLSLGQGLRILIDTGFSTGTAQGLNEAIATFMVLVCLLAAGTFVRFFLVSWIGERVVADIRREVYNHVVNLHPGFFESNLSSEIQSRITTDTTLLQTVIGASFSMALRNIPIFFGGLIWLFITNPRLTTVVLLSVPVVMIPIIVFGRKVRNLSRSSQDKIADVGTYVGESLKNIKIVQAFNHEEHDKRRFSDEVELAFSVAKQRITHRAILTGMVMVLVMGAIAIMMWIGGHDVLSGRITAGELTAFIFYAVMIAVSVATISEVWGDVQRAAGAMERLLELLNTDSKIVAPQNPKHLPQPVRGQLELDHVQFFYESRPELAAIDDITLTLPAGESLALVGSSGAGKSTIVDLILRFHDIQKGHIKFDGVDIRDLDPHELRSHIALVPQQPVLFSGTVADNIRYSLPDASDEAVIQAAQAAYAHEFIERLPQGYNSFVGESGVRLSGGQRQRIAIARAILKDPKLLLLDEATSALDAESEFQVQKALQRLMQNRSTIVIAHRLATVVNVNRIAVLEHGKLVDLGNHQQLISSSPLYKRWSELQFGMEAVS